MSFEEAEHYLAELGIDAMKGSAPTLHRIEALCEELNHPERAVPAIHVTGTNGKTSTARIATALLAATGLRVGTYTSPHLETITERIARSGEPISPVVFGEIFEHIRPYVELVEKRLDETLSFFEVLTGMFFLWTAEEPVDALVVEVGLGGRWDATNVISAPVAILTNVSLDHTGLLGTDRVTIAREKAGIIKEGADVVSAERIPEIVAAIEKSAGDVDADAFFIERDWRVSENRVALGGRYLSFETTAGPYEDLFLPLHGSHQGMNAGTALEAVVRFLPAQTLERAVVEEGLANATVPGRIETFAQTAEGATVVLDVAHNPEGISALVGALAEAFAFDKVHFVLGILADKDYRGMLAELTRIPCSIIATEPKGMRGVSSHELMTSAREVGIDAEAIDDPLVAVERAIGRASRGELVCVTGSHYVVGDIRARVAADGRMIQRTD